MKAVSLTMASLMALLIASFACAFAFAFPFPFPAAGTAKDKESIPFVPEHNQQPAPILPRSSTAVLDFGDALLHEGGNSRPVVKPTPHESPASSIVISSSIKDNDDETEENTNHPQQQQPEKQGKPIHHDDDDADDEAGGSRSSSFRNEQVSIDDASEQVNDLVAFGHAAADASVLGTLKLRFARDITSNVQQLMMVGKKGKEGADKKGEADEDEDDVTRTGMGMGTDEENDNDGDGKPVIVGHKKRRPIIPHQHQPAPSTDPNNTVPVPTA